MKDLTALLSKGNLTPKERILLWVANRVSEERDGKKILTEADERALTRGWTPKDNNEANEYNRFNDGWNTAGSARLDAQTIYLNAEIRLLQASRLVDYFVYADEEKIIKRSENIFEKADIDEDEALNIILKNSGLTFDDVAHRRAFASLGEDMRHDILALCPDAKTESQYLDQEEAIAHLFNGRDTLTQEAKEKFADAVVDAFANKHADYFRAKGLSSEDWRFDGYYAEIPGIAILKKWAEYNGVEYEADDAALKKAEQAQANAKNASELIAGDNSLDPEFRKDQLRREILTEKIKECAKKRETDIGKLLRQTILRWLDQGLLIDEYAPIWNSKDKDTCNNIDTKLPHRTVFKKWLAAKDDAKALLQKLIDKGDLVVERRRQRFLGMERIVKIITGESLYHLEDDIAFAQDFKKQADDLLPFGRLIVFLRERSFFEDYASLLKFGEIFQRLSKTYEVDAGYKINYLIRCFQERIDQLNHELRYVAEKLEEASRLRHDIVFSIETFVEDMLIDLEKVEPGAGETEMHYFNEFQKILGGDF